MTDHLRPDEFVDALDGVLASSREVHLAECADCRAELESLLVAQSTAHADATQEPSPLFWDHFSARVREATAAEPIALTLVPWWRSGWQPVTAVAAAAALVVLMIQLRPSPGPDVVAPAPLATSASTDFVIDDDGSWDIVMGLASGIPWEDVREAVAPAAGAADAAIEELTPAQRDALVRLLKQEIGE